MSARPSENFIAASSQENRYTPGEVAITACLQHSQDNSCRCPACQVPAGAGAGGERPARRPVLERTERSCVGAPGLPPGPGKRPCLLLFQKVLVLSMDCVLPVQEGTVACLGEQGHWLCWCVACASGHTTPGALQGSSAQRPLWGGGDRGSRPGTFYLSL